MKAPASVLALLPLAPDLPEGPGKECSACCLFKPLHDFARQVDGPKGRRSHCRVCDRKRDRARWERQNGPRYWRRDYDRPHYLYRLFDAQGDLLYVGITYDLLGRFYRGYPGAGDKGPHCAKYWWAEVDRVTVETYQDGRQAESAEFWAIEEEAPRYNARGGVLHHEDRPEPIDRWGPGSLDALAARYPSSRL